MSIVVIAFNEADDIGDCVTALTAQETDIGFEIVVVDDGSTDRNAEAVRALGAGELRNVGRFRWPPGSPLAVTAPAVG